MKELIDFLEKKSLVSLFLPYPIPAVEKWFWGSLKNIFAEGINHSITKIFSFCFFAKG
ncbi:hypothetical protein [Rickettsia endosymbiont of Polydrusus tereticollis]|uniref:hypothetical protein n=1 Tax=Rickettsia endosymbiont of Polydrusus tereticollis TaxID=3066251 RepID=UPI003132ADB5